MEQVELKNISKIYGSAKTNEVRALDNISFSIPNGQFVVILGASSKTECRIAFESNYFDEIYSYL